MSRASLRRLNLFLFRLLCGFDGLFLSQDRLPLPFFLLLLAGHLVLHALLERTLTFMLYDILFHLKPLLHVRMLLHDLVLGLLLFEGTLFAQVSLLLSTQPGSFFPVQRLLV